MFVVFITFLSLFAFLGLAHFVKGLIYAKLLPEKIIIHTLNNENDIEYTVRGLRARCPECEILIDDGGSSDDTLLIAERLGLLPKS